MQLLFNYRYSKLLRSNRKKIVRFRLAARISYVCVQAHVTICGYADEHCNCYVCVLCGVQCL